MTEPAINGMPRKNSRLAELPAQKHHFAILRTIGEIDQTEVDILEKASHRLDRLGAFGEPCRRLTKLWITLEHLRQSQPFRLRIMLNYLGNLAAKFRHSPL